MLNKNAKKLLGFKPVAFKLMSNANKNLKYKIGSNIFHFMYSNSLEFSKNSYRIVSYRIFFRAGRPVPYMNRFNRTGLYHEPVFWNRFHSRTSSTKPVRKWNRFNKKLVLEPVYETGLPALIFFKNLEKKKQRIKLSNLFQIKIKN